MERAEEKIKDTALEEELVAESSKQHEGNPVEHSIEKIKKEQAEVEESIHSALAKIVKKFSGLGIDVLQCTKLDIEGADVEKEVEFLRKCHLLKESNERALLRLKIGRVTEEFMSTLESVASAAKSLSEWAANVQRSIKEIEDTVVERNTLSEVYTGAYIVEKYEKFAQDVAPVEYILEQACLIASRHRDIFPEKERADFLLSESFIKLSSQEERVLRHLLSVALD
ncbi:hypothetical protein NEMIN01_0972 [Nematocida minor]|uniref:uncharacterized protein n=1 Tax=Nematocida minor TaxID=1912983 RepID=UPI00221E547D|nr:uncharacterized protein NEMIN01_0972 [Nematocida minor]KAI5190273.1 hypothetical protein NEMIN01_0972 [Nematocida minor]